MDPYQRMIQYWGVMFDRRNGLAPLDCMNFSLRHFPEVLRVSDVAAIHRLESGYASPDGAPELGALIRSSTTRGSSGTAPTASASTARSSRARASAAAPEQRAPS
ncbi:MAG: hypothetical protein U0326_36150 [Polyangiales bacterium]